MAQRKFSVLVVDDETSNIIALTHILQPEYNIYVAKNGETAINAARKHSPDVILLDVIMPDMDGYAVITMLKETDITKNIPVIFITGLSNPIDEERGLNLGAADYIVKPFSSALVKCRVLNQIKLLEQFRSNEYDIMKYKLSNDALNIALWDMDVVGGDLLNPANKFTWSQEFRYMLGFSDTNDFPNRLDTWSTRLHPEDKDETLTAFEAHLSDYTGRTPYDVENRIMMKNGQYRYFRALGTTHRDKDGKPLRVAGALMDITAKKQMEQEISNHMAKIEKDAHWYKSILDAIPLPVTVTDADMKWTFVNTATEDFLGLKLADMLGKSCSEWNKEICGTGKCGIACAKQGIKRTFFNHKESSYQVDTEILRDMEGETAGFIEIVQDITNIQDLVKKRTEAEAVSQAKSSFLANMSHEIRTPMNAIIGITEILMQEDNQLTEKVKDGLGRIYNSCDLLLGIINDILDFSKIEANKIDIVTAKYNVADLINDSVNLNAMRIGEKNIEFEVDIDENLPQKLIGDELRIKQILNNLLSNAFKYTTEGKVQLAINHFSPDDSQDTAILVLVVKDTGSGMTERQVEVLFEEYTRFSKKAIEGTGLGLAITHRLITLMEGNINVESKPGGGSTFTVKLPQLIVKGDVIGREQAENLRNFSVHNYITSNNKAQIIRSPMPYGSVLVVDDVETNLYVAEGLMRPYKLKIETAISGFKAIEKIKSGKKYDIIFMDHMMPEMDGIETAKKIREMGYKQPIVALTANAVAGQSELFLKNGFDRFISKPIDIRRLDSVLNKLIRNKQPEAVIKAAELQEIQEKPPHNNEEPNTSNKVSPLLESFVNDARKTIAVLDELCRTRQYDNADNLQKLIVTVHGIKVALHNIGEIALSESAKKLEIAGRERDVDYIKCYAPELLEELLILIKKHGSRHNDRDSNDDAKALVEMLSEVRNLCVDYKRKPVLDILFAMSEKPCSEKTRRVLAQIKQNVLHSEFEEAEKSAEEYINSLSDITVAIPSIDGIDVQKGLERYDGSMEIYLKILRSFALNARRMLDSLADDEFEDERSLKSYEITVHGFKGMSFDIFAEEIGEKAKALEFAAKASDIDYIREHNPLFVEAARKVVANAETVIAGADAQNSNKPQKPEPDTESLLRLYNACEIYDMDSVETAIAEINAFGYTSDDGLAEWLIEKAELMDYMAITEKLSDIK